jgi:hypothetical protein
MFYVNHGNQVVYCSKFGYIYIELNEAKMSLVKLSSIKLGSSTSNK